VTVFIDVNDDRFTPAEEKVAHAGAENHGQTQPHIVRHEDQHEAVGEEHLDHVQEGL